MSDGINDAAGREPDYSPTRAKYKGKWGVWDCGYFYPDKPKRKKVKKNKGKRRG